MQQGLLGPMPQMPQLQMLQPPGLLFQPGQAAQQAQQAAGQAEGARVQAQMQPQEPREVQRAHPMLPNAGPALQQHTMTGPAQPIFRPGLIAPPQQQNQGGRMGRISGLLSGALSLLGGG